MKSQDGKKAMKKSRLAAAAKRQRGDNNTAGGNNWKKKMKKALKTPSGLKSIMSVLAAEEQTNSGLVSALQTQVTLPPAPPLAQVIPPTPIPVAAQASSLIGTAFPGTSVKLQSILKKNN